MRKFFYALMLLLDLSIVGCQKEETVKVSSVSLDMTSISLTEGSSTTLVASISPSNATNKKVVWMSSNNSVASVNNGTVTAVSTGSATITAISDDGSKTADCIVTVAPLQCVEFDDEYFKRYCLLIADNNKDGKLSIKEAELITEIVDPNSLLILHDASLTPEAAAIHSFKGIEMFINLERIVLHCPSFPSFAYYPSKIDFSSNIKLKELICNGLILFIDVSNNTALTSLDCSGSQLTSLDVNKNTALTTLCCNDNRLTSLDISKNTALTRLSCYSNHINNLDVSMNTALTELDCSYNQLTSLDVSKNTALTRLSCYSNHINSLDVSMNTALTELDCSYNQLTSLDVSKSTALTALYCSHNQLTSLDVSRNTTLNNLDCRRNSISNIYVWKGFDSTLYPFFFKDDSAQYIEVE